MTTAPSTPDTIVLVHGFWVTPRSWEHWVAQKPWTRTIVSGVDGAVVMTCPPAG